ncbi:hypothetical protein B0H13DRAFT_1905998 [Mycena leptocephala]|nr:hypothetical protein B0H13DRAFT_1905998 [Mycena leptocephala]
MRLRVFGDHPLHSLVLGYCWCSAADILLDLPNLVRPNFLLVFFLFSLCLLSFVVLGGSTAAAAAARAGRYLDSFKPPSFLGERLLLESLCSRFERLSTGPSKVIKVEKCPVDTMDVDDKPAAPPPKKVNRSGKGVSAVLNTAESSSQTKEQPLPRPKNSSTRAPAERAPDLHRPSGGLPIGCSIASTLPVPRPKTRVVDLESITIEENLQIDNSFDFEISHARPSEFRRMYTLHIQDAEEIGKTYKAVEARDPHGFRKTMEIFATEGFALSCTGEWLLSFGETVGNLVAFFNAICLIRAAVQYRYGTLEPLDPLPTDPDHPIFLDAQDPQPRWRQYTREVFPPFNGQQYLSMGNYDEVWMEYKAALAKHEESESAKEAAFMERQWSKFSEWKKRTKEYRDKIPGLHQYQSERILAYIEERKGVLAELETRMNTLGCYILYHLCAQFEEEDRALENRFPTASSRLLNLLTWPQLHHIGQTFTKISADNMRTMGRDLDIKHKETEKLMYRAASDLTLRTGVPEAPDRLM